MSSNVLDQQTLQSIWPGWELKEHLGSGSFGSVYRAVHQENGIASTAAIKVISIPSSPSEISSLRSEFHTDEGTRTYLENVKNDVVKEISLMNSLKGVQNIVNLEDFKVLEKTDEVGWTIYIRMELLTTLTDYIRQVPITELDVLRLGQDICTALEICEREHILHRDIKPENIFHHPMGYYKLGDFGIAKEMQHSSSGLSKKGTPNYMAPEVARALPYDSRADLYSLGIVLYRLLNGDHLPFIFNDVQSMNPNDRERALNQRLAGEIPPPPAYASEPSAAIIMKAIHPDPNQRFSTAGEMRYFLQQVIYSMETGRPLTPAFWGPFRAGNNHSATYKVNPPVGGMAAASAGISPQVPPSIPSSASASSPKKSSMPMLWGILAGLTAVAALLVIALISGIFSPDKKPDQTSVDDSSEISSSATDSGECPHTSWDPYNEIAHSCHECGIREEHQWVSDDTSTFCSICFEISAQQNSVIEESEEQGAEESKEESIPDPVLVAETSLASHDEWIVSVSNSSNGSASIHNASEDIALGNFTDNFSTTWMNAYKFWLYKGDGFASQETVTYSLAGQSYNVLTGTIVGGKITSGRCSSGYSMYFNIYADGVLVYTSPTVTQNTPAFTYEVNIEGASTITIEGVTDTERVSAEGLITLNLQEYR